MKCENLQTQSLLKTALRFLGIDIIHKWKNDYTALYSQKQTFLCV